MSLGRSSEELKGRSFSFQVASAHDKLPMTLHSRIQSLGLGSAYGWTLKVICAHEHKETTPSLSPPLLTLSAEPALLPLPKIAIHFSLWSFYPLTSVTLCFLEEKLDPNIQSFSSMKSQSFWAAIRETKDYGFIARRADH